MTEYKEEDYLQLSGIQHFCFCRRQWALIHIENQWADNLRTVEGELLHSRVHDPGNREIRGNIVITRDMRVFSTSLGISGACDVVEFHLSDDGIPLKGREGLFRPYPIEYKHGSPKESHADLLQLCAQAICLEEMLCCNVPKGAIYYGETRRRSEIELSDSLREEVRTSLSEMHILYEKGHTPKVRPSKSCNACSLKDICLPKLMRAHTVADYISKRLGDTE